MGRARFQIGWVLREALCQARERHREKANRKTLTFLCLRSHIETIALVLKDQAILQVLEKQGAGVVANMRHSRPTAALFCHHNFCAHINGSATIGALPMN